MICVVGGVPVLLCAVTRVPGGALAMSTLIAVCAAWGAQRHFARVITTMIALTRSLMSAMS